MFRFPKREACLMAMSNSYELPHGLYIRTVLDMKVTATLLRRNGFRIQKDNRQIAGELVIAERRIRDGMLRLAAEIQAPGAMLGDGPRVLAILFDPEIRAWRGASLKLNGWEIIEWKGEGRQLVVQEWACSIDGY